MEEWQLRVMEGVIATIDTTAGEALLNRTRGGSKSTDLVILSIYFAYLGYKVILFGPNGEQTDTLAEYLKEQKDNASLFLREIMIKKTMMLRTKTSLRMQYKGKILVKNAGGAGKRSKRGDVVIYDEERELPPANETAAEGTQAGTQMLLKVHASTPFENSVFHKNYLRLKREEKEIGQQLVFEKPWFEIPRFYDDLRIRNKFLRLKEKYRREGRLWEFEVEYECKFNMPKGRVFTNVNYNPYSHEVLHTVSQGKKVAGIDWNPVNGHWLVAGVYIRNKTVFVVTDALSLGVGYSHDIEPIYKLSIPFFTYGNEINLEDGGLNNAFTEMFKRLYDASNLEYLEPLVTYTEVNRNDDQKHYAAMYARTKMVLIDELRFPELAEAIRTWSWDVITGKINIKPYDEPHAGDAWLLAMELGRREIEDFETFSF